MGESERDVLAYMSFPRQHRTRLQSTSPIERLNKKVKRRAIGAGLFEQNDEWRTFSKYMQVEAFAQIDQKETDPIPSISTQAA